MAVFLMSILPMNFQRDKARHYVGLPPELAGGVDNREEMRGAAFLIIEQKPDGFFLYRYNDKGECVGDTWHMSIDDAKGQADSEYGANKQPWQLVANEDGDVVNIALGVLKASRAEPIG